MLNTFPEDVPAFFAGGGENHGRTDEEILMAALESQSMTE